MTTRYDWSPQTSSLIIRMPTSVHDLFTESIVDEIKYQLRCAPRAHNDVATIIDLIRSEMTSDVYLYGHGAIGQRYSKRSPDASFAHVKSQYPSVIIETSYSQQQKDLAQLADDYICGSDGNIAVVLGFNIKYSAVSQRATLSVWRPRVGPDLRSREEEVIVLETVGVQEDDVTSMLCVKMFLC